MVGAVAGNGGAFRSVELRQTGTRMKRIAFGSLTLAMAWVGSADPCSALPVFSPQPVAEAESAFLLTRHRRHHHHWRGHHRHSRRGGPASEGLKQPVEGD